MKQIRRLLAILAALCLCMALAPAACADDAETETPTEDAADVEQTPTEDAGSAAEKIDFEGLSWQDVVDKVLQRFDVEPESVKIGYCSLATGEELYLNGDDYQTAASMYKVPLNMLATELIESGELDWDGRFPDVTYEYVREETIVQSNNDWAMFLWENALGGYESFRRGIAPYMGVDPDNVDGKYYENNYFTARQMISCLKTLYTERDRFPGIIEAMQQAEPERFFKLKESRFDIAHKYGYAHDDNNIHSYMNDCGFAFTDEPIALVMFTDNVDQAEELLTAFCTAMCDYTQYRSANSPKATPEPEDAAAPAATAAPAAPAVTVAPAAIERERISVPILPCLLVIAAVAAALLLILAGKRKYHIRPFWLCISVLLSGCAMLLGVVAMSAGTVYAKPQGDPRAAVTEFFDAVKAGDYTSAYARLRDYSSLGLETPPESEAAALAYAALHESYDYELLGDCVSDKLDAVQQVRFTYLDLARVQEAAKGEVMGQLEKLVQSRPSAQIYDENDQYLPEVANEAYVMAVKAVLKDAGSYYAQADFNLALAYDGGSWRIVANPTLLSALNGGTGY